MKIISSINARLFKLLCGFFDRRDERKYERCQTHIDPSITLISNNCTGGFMYHALKFQFLSPTINTLIKDEDFIPFCQNLKDYLNGPLLEKKSSLSYPVAALTSLHPSTLKPVEISFPHETSFSEALIKWNRRKERINWNNIVIVGDGYDRPEILSQLEKRKPTFPYPSFFFSIRKMDKFSNVIYLRNFHGRARVALGGSRNRIGQNGLAFTHFEKTIFGVSDKKSKVLSPKRK